MVSKSVQGREYRKGKELISQYCKMKSIELSDINKPEYQNKILRKYGFHDWDSALATVGHGGLKESQVVNRMLEEYKKDHVVPMTDSDVLENIRMRISLRRSHRNQRAELS